MKKHIEKSTKLTASECLSLAILQHSLQQILGSNQIVFTQIDLSGREKFAQTGTRRIKLKIIHIEAVFVDIDMPRGLHTSVDAYITLEKQNKPIPFWRPFQVGIDIKNCGLKTPHVLMPLYSARAGTVEDVIVEFAQDLIQQMSNHSK